MTTKRVALFRTDGGSEIVLAFYPGSCDGFTRISEYVDVEFPPLTPESKAEQLLRLKAEREAAKKKLESLIAGCDERAAALGT